MQNHTYYYARVCSLNQSLSRQIEAFKVDGLTDEHNLITDETGGKTLDLPGYQMLKTQTLKSGDTLVVMSLDRLGRNKDDIRGELQYYKEHSIRVRILDLPTTSIKVGKDQQWVIEMVDNLLIEVLASMAQHERLTIRRRQAEGIAIAKAKGKYKGRQPIRYDQKLFGILYEQYRTRQITKKEMAEKLSVSYSTVDRILDRRHLIRSKNGVRTYLPIDNKDN